MRGFDFLAPFYDRLVTFVFGSSILHASTHYFDHIKNGDKILIIGGGTGKILSYIKNSDIEVTYVELSEKMIAKAKSRKTPYKISFIRGSYTAVPGEEYDVVITAFFMDLFDTAHGVEIVNYIKNNIKPGALWLFADFEKPQKYWQQVLLWFMYRFFRIICKIEAKRLPDYESIFSPGFESKKEKYFYHRLIVSRIYKLEK